MQFIPHKYLVILIFAGLLSAQTADHRFDVIPSTDDSETGKVCFHEKLANGSNTICLTVPASLAVDTDIDLGNLDSGGWMRTGTVLHPANLADKVSIGNSSSIADLYIRDENSTAGSRITNLVIRGGQDQGFSPHVTLQDTSGGDLAFIGETIAFVEGAGDQPAVLWRNGIRLSRSLNKCIGWVNAPTVWSGADDVQICGGANEIKLTNGSTGTSGISAGFGNFSAVGGTWDNYVRARKFEFVDSGLGAAGGEGAWDAWADVQAVGSISAFRLRDNSGNAALRLVRTFTGFNSDSAYLDMHLLPNTDLARNLGATGRVWLTANIQTLKNPTNDTVYVEGLFFAPYSNNVVELGSTSLRWKKVWGRDANLDGSVSVNNLTVNGTCTGCGSSLFTDGGATTYLTATGDNLCIGCTSTAAKARIEGSAGVELSHAAIFDSFIGEKLRFYRDGSGDFGVTIAASTMLLHADDPGSTIQLGRKDTGAAFTQWASFGSASSQVSGDWLPATDNALDLGSRAKRWSGATLAQGGILEFWDGAVQRMLVQGNAITMKDAGGVTKFSVTSSGSTLVGDLTITGTCTGCPSGSSLFTDGGATTYLTATGDNLCIGCTSTAYKLQISGEIASNDIDPITDNFYDLGSRTKRWAGLRMAHGGVIETFDGSVARFALTSGGLTWRDAGNTIMWTISSSGTGSFGSVASVSGYSYNGSSGLTGAYNVGACTMTFQGGILTSTTC